MFPNLVTCPDGTMLDFKTGKVIVDPNKGARPGEWAKLKTINPPQACASSESWNDQPSSANYTPQASGSLSTRDSEEYWRAQAAAEQAKRPEMTDAQKKMLADLESGKIMKLSRLELVDESTKKIQSKPI